MFFLSEETRSSTREEIMTKNSVPRRILLTAWTLFTYLVYTVALVAVGLMVTIPFTSLVIHFAIAFAVAMGLISVGMLGVLLWRLVKDAWEKTE